MGRKPGRRPGRSVLRVYVRTRTRPGDRARREKTPAAPTASSYPSNCTYTTDPSERYSCPSGIDATAVALAMELKRLRSFNG